MTVNEVRRGFGDLKNLFSDILSYDAPFKIPTFSRSSATPPSFSTTPNSSLLFLSKLTPPEPLWSDFDVSLCGEAEEDKPAEILAIRRRSGLNLKTQTMRATTSRFKKTRVEELPAESLVVMRACAETFGTSIEEMRGRVRNRNIADARHAYAYLISKIYPRFSSIEVGGLQLTEIIRLSYTRGNQLNQGSKDSTERW